MNSIRTCIVCLLLTLSGNAFAQQNYTRVVDRNYTTGVKTFANVGEPIAKIKDYWQIQTDFSAFRADEQFKISGCMSFGGWTVPAHQDLPVVSTKERKGVSYSVVQVPKMYGLLMLVDPQGNVPGYLIQQMTGLGQGCKYTVTPPITLKPVVANKVDVTRGYTNFELVYLGVAGQTMRFLYREYTQDDMARPAFTQEITYDRTATDVTFKKLKFKIELADSSKITYTVVEDSM